MKRKDNVLALTDYGTKEARNHGETVYELQSAKTGHAKRARKLTPCQRLANRRENGIRPEHRDAADRLATDWFEAGFEPSTTVNLFAIRGGPRDYTPRQLKAREEFNEAMKAVGSAFSGILYEVCCLESSVSELEENMNWRDGLGVPMLRAGLHALAAHYGYLKITDPVEKNS